MKILISSGIPWGCSAQLNFHRLKKNEKMRKYNKEKKMKKKFIEDSPE